MNDDTAPDEKPAPEWREVTRLPVQDEMVKVLRQVREATEAEIARLREQLDRARHGG